MANSRDDADSELREHITDLRQLAEEMALTAEGVPGMNLALSKARIARVCRAFLSLLSETPAIQRNSPEEVKAALDKAGETMGAYAGPKEKNSPLTRSAAAFPQDYRRKLEESNLPIEVATAIADRLDAAVSASQQSDTAKLYHDLLLSVGNRYPGETRHETVKRYILEAERGGLHAGQAYADSAPVSSTASKEGP